MTTPELKPCPFCGAVPRFDGEQGMAVCVLCGECGASSDFSPAGREDEAAAAWNTRANMEALRAEVERLRKLHQDAYQRGHQSGSRGLREAYDAIQEVKRQDAWGNAQLTEALLAAEERAERVEFENAALQAENERLKEQLTAPPGWKLVPVEPTPEMVDSARKHHEGQPYLPASLYRAMLAAAPEVKP